MQMKITQTSINVSEEGGRGDVQGTGAEIWGMRLPGLGMRPASTELGRWDYKRKSVSFSTSISPKVG